MAKGDSLVPMARIERAILFIRDQKVILDRDLADLYGVETRVLVQAVKRNMKRFPRDFMFQLSKTEPGRLEITICDVQSGWQNGPAPKVAHS